MSSQSDIAQQFLNGGVIPADLVGQVSVSKTYVDAQNASRDAQLAIVSSAAGTAQATIDSHKASAVAHSASSITYSGSVAASTVKGAIDTQNQRIDNIVAGAGASNTEIIDARQPATGSAFPVLRDRLNNVDAQLADIVNNAPINIVQFGADKTGLVSSTSAINAAIAAAAVGNQIIFPEGTYIVDSTINWNKKVSLIAIGRVTLKAIASMTAIITCTRFVEYHTTHLDGFYFDCNHLTNHGLLLDGSVDGYITRLLVENCEVRNALLDGIDTVAPAFVIGFKNTLCNENGRDGIRAIVPNFTGTQQLNHIYIDDNCICNDNAEAGVNIMGTNHYIGNIDAEGNRDGIKIDMSQSTGQYVAWNISINDTCYIENNKRSQVFLKAMTADQIHVSIKDNYINTFYNGAGAGDTLILCSGPSESITLTLDDNFYSLSGGVVTKILDGGNALSSRGEINEGLYLNESRFVNLGLIRVQWDYYKNIQLPATTCKGPGAKSLFETENLLNLSQRSVSYPVLVDMTQSLVQAVYASIVSDCTSYEVTVYVIEVDIATGDTTKITGFEITGGGNQDWGSSVVNNWGYYRIPYGRQLMVRIDVGDYTGGTSLTIKCPYLKII